MKALATLCLLALAGAAQAQTVTPPACPQLPADTGLTWEYRPAGNADFCLAKRADGSEVLGVFIAADPPFQPERRNRTEQGTVDGREVRWYRGEVASRPDVLVRETLVTLGDGRVAHVWVQARDEQTLAQEMQMAQQLRFPESRLSTR
ncbi:hypothetical protein [Vulcaniibacterium gelatinicum]|uniref:hypothetical protein n=1 Tax=Vulcaniibacterium gelatinicum TaxID=2598725 RepID=UPI0011C6FE30|nr:hypothetical protein [Vulcaniibacterium gelatinicum]